MGVNLRSVSGSFFVVGLSKKNAEERDAGKRAVERQQPVVPEMNVNVHVEGHAVGRRVARARRDARRRRVAERGHAEADAVPADVAEAAERVAVRARPDVAAREELRSDGCGRGRARRELSLSLAEYTDRIAHRTLACK